MLITFLVILAIWYAIGLALLPFVGGLLGEQPRNSSVPPGSDASPCRSGVIERDVGRFLPKLPEPGDSLARAFLRVGVR